MLCIGIFFFNAEGKYMKAWNGTVNGYWTSQTCIVAVIVSINIVSIQGPQEACWKTLSKLSQANSWW